MPFRFFVNIRQPVFPELHQITSNYMNHNHLIPATFQNIFFSNFSLPPVALWPGTEDPHRGVRLAAPRLQRGVGGASATSAGAAPFWTLPAVPRTEFFLRWRRLKPLKPWQLVEKIGMMELME